MNENYIKIVTNLNRYIYRLGIDSEFITFDYQTNGIDNKINFCGIQVWSSKRETRKFNLIKNDFEDLENHILKKIENVIDNLAKVKGIN